MSRANKYAYSVGLCAEVNVKKGKDKLTRETQAEAARMQGDGHILGRAQRTAV
jgi:hypothetical protein